MSSPSVCAALYRAKENMGRIRPHVVAAEGPPQTPMGKLESAMSILYNKTGKCPGIF